MRWAAACERWGSAHLEVGLVDGVVVLVAAGHAAGPLAVVPAQGLVEQHVVQIRPRVVVPQHQAQRAEGPRVREALVVHHAVVAVRPAHLGMHTMRSRATSATCSPFKPKPACAANAPEPHAPLVHKWDHAGHQLHGSATCSAAQLRLPLQ